MMQVQETDLRYYIDRSTIQGAGLGLFAKEALKAGDCLEVIGVLVSGLSEKCSKYADRYKFLAPDKKSVIVPLGFAGMVNHTEDKARQNVEIWCMEKNYMKRSQHATQIVYGFLRDIAAGEELLGHYGDEYSQFLGQFLKDSKTVEDNEDEWRKFLAFDLYNLKSLLP